MDAWKEHVALEISDAFGDPDRLLAITQALLRMEEESLMPQPVSDELFNQIDMLNEGGQ